jgi:hypothetical protein
MGHDIQSDNFTAPKAVEYVPIPQDAHVLLSIAAYETEYVPVGQEIHVVLVVAPILLE